MANVLIEKDFGWNYDDAQKWSFYTSDNYSQFAAADGLDITAPGVDFYFAGKDLTYEKDGKDINGANQYNFTGGTITGLTIGNIYSHIYLSDISISAKQLNALMLNDSAAASAKIFGAILSGDDDLTLSYGDDRFASFDGDDVIRGRVGNDWINAGAGDDLLYGGSGKDTLIGGAGRDDFVFDTKANSKNVDLITDFSVKDDAIIIDHLIYRDIGKAGDLASGAFLSNMTGKAEDASDRIIYDSKTGDLFFDADGSGKGAAVQFATLDPHLKLTAADFDII